MKKIVWEMCESTDFIKEDGLFACQGCGCKYSMEEAKKMMIEGTVDVQGTVKVDNSAFVEKYLANARRAKAKEDWSETEKYYNMVEQTHVYMCQGGGYFAGHPYICGGWKCGCATSTLT